MSKHTHVESLTLSLLVVVVTTQKRSNPIAYHATMAHVTCLRLSRMLDPAKVTSDVQIRDDRAGEPGLCIEGSKLFAVRASDPRLVHLVEDVLRRQQELPTTFPMEHALHAFHQGQATTLP